MSWVTFMWPVMTGACATMAYLQLVIWLRQRETASLLFALLAASVAVISVGELIMMQSTDARFYGDVLRWVHVPGAAMFMFLAMFVRVQYPAARAALCWSVVATRRGAGARSPRIHIVLWPTMPRQSRRPQWYRRGWASTRATSPPYADGR